MDLNMPVMDGFKSAKKIKDYYNESQIYNLNQNTLQQEDITIQSPYIVALTGCELSEEIKKQCEDSMIDDFYTQPLKVQDI
jgi:CheY-like chemotaxis protein